MIKMLSALSLLLLLFFGMDVADRRYATHAELKADGGGWLPDILPGSAHDIRTVNNLDLNQSWGEFDFIDTDAGAFFATLTLGIPDDSPYEDWTETAKEYRGRGYVAWSYREDGEVWSFFCHPVEDRCEYFSWHEQSSGHL